MKKNLEAILALGVVAMIGLVGMIYPRGAQGFMDVNVVITTSMPSRVVVASATSTGTDALPTRVDNWNLGLQGTVSGNLLAGRVGLCCQNLDAADEVYCNVGASVSTNTAKTTIGKKVVAGDLYCADVDRTLKVSCAAADAAGAAGVVMACEQVGRNFQ